MKNNSAKGNRGFSLLELVVTTAILATVATATMALVRSSYTTWNVHDDDQTQRQESLAVLRHLGRQVRQSKAVMAISSPADNSGTLTLLMPSGESYVWEHDSSSQEVRFGIGAASSLLANGIAETVWPGDSVQFRLLDQMLKLRGTVSSNGSEVDN